jgi:hypothetical protein
MAWIRIVGRDLKDRDRLERAATALGLGVDTGDGPPALIVIDLDREGVPTDLPPGITSVGYYSHVDAKVAERAEALGIAAIRRGTFWTDLEAILGPVADEEGSQES